MANEISIEYCVVWNYEPKAAGLAADIREQTGLAASLIKGSGGVFEVVFDGELIFSKRKLGRFPDHGEVEEAIGRRMAG